MKKALQWNYKGYTIKQLKATTSYTTMHGYKVFTELVHLYSVSKSKHLLHNGFKHPLLRGVRDAMDWIDARPTRPAMYNAKKYHELKKKISEFKKNPKFQLPLPRPLYLHPMNLDK